MNWISTEYGNGRIIKQGVHPCGIRWYLVAIAGYGRKFISPRHIRYMFKFSLN